MQMPFNRVKVGGLGRRPWRSLPAVLLAGVFAQAMGQTSPELALAAATVVPAAQTSNDTMTRTANEKRVDKPSDTSPSLNPSDTMIFAIIEQAVSSHPTVLAKQAEAQGGKLGVESAKWQYYPTPSVVSERGTGTSNGASGTPSTTTLRLQQPLWAGGRIDASVKVAEMRALSSQLAVDEAKLTIALRTLETWQNLLAAYGRRQVAINTLGKLDKLNEMMIRRVQSQISPQIDSELMKSRLIQAQSDVVSATLAWNIAIQKMNNWAGDVHYLGLSEASIFKLLERLSPLSPHKNSRAALIASVSQHPTILRNQADIGIAQSEYTQKVAEQWPTVYARVDRVYPHNNPTTSSATTSAYLGFQYTPGAGLSSRSAAQQALSKIAVLQGDRDAIMRDIQERYESEWLDHMAATERLQNARQSQNSTNEVLESYTRLFVTGRRSWLEVLNAVRELSQADTTLVDLQAQAHTGAVRLKVYLGELPWQIGE